MESYDSIFEHLNAVGAGERLPDRLRGDLDDLMTRYERFISRPNRTGLVEISPYLAALLHPSDRRSPANPANLRRDTVATMAVGSAVCGFHPDGISPARPSIM